MEAKIQECDARGLTCPLPILKLRKALQALDTGQRLRLLTTDPVASLDVPHFCLQENHNLISHETGEPLGQHQLDVFIIEKGAAKN